MALPRVKIYFDNGLLGSTSPSDDGVVGLVASGVAVSGKFVLGTAYLLTKLDDLTNLGITADSGDANANIYKVVKEHYTDAVEGSKLWFMGVAHSVLVSSMVDKTQSYATALINAANGAINVLIIDKVDNTGIIPTILHALDGDIYTALTNAQALAEWATDVKFAPLFVLLPARHYTGVAADLSDLTAGEFNRVGIFLGDTIISSNNASIGLLSGRIASIPVQRSVARVKTGALGVTQMYIGAVTAENGNPDVISDKGFITARTFVGKTGYFFTDDKLATETTDDYALIPRRRTIDKAYRIAYQTLVQEIGDELPVTSDGNIPAPIAKSIQNVVETAIENNMTANGNLGVDPSNPKDTGVTCYIDYKQNVVALSILTVKLKVKPFGYPKYIDVYLGFSAGN